MNDQRSGLFRRVFGGLYRAVDATRRFVVNLIFLLVLILIVALLAAGGKDALKEKTTLVLKPRGEIVEQYSGDPIKALIARLFGEELPETRLRDVLLALDAAAKDDKISQVLLHLGDFGGAGVATLREVARAIDRFQEVSGKKVIAYGEYLGQPAYYLAAHADEVYIHPEGLALIEGLGRYRSYYRTALDKLGIKMHVFRVGTYKSAVEPYLLDGPSEAAQEADRYWLGDLWQVMLADIAKARGVEASELQAMIDELPQRLAAVGGNPAQLALSEKLIDGTKTPDELRAMLMASGAKDDKEETFRQIALNDYVERVRQPVRGDQQVGVIVAAGEITGGEQPGGVIGGKSTSALVRQAREDQNIKAIVLRVDSPGGSGFDSELIRREIEITRQAGKPVVVSMGDVAASGGYWISMTSDAIYADHTTITGSIGIFGLFPDVSETMDKIGVHTGGTTTTWLAGALNPTRPLDPRLGEVLQSVVNNGYQDFIGKVAEARGKTPAEIDQVAQGRVWSGQQALERGLVDRIGGLPEAIADAAERAGIGDDYEVVYVEKKQTGLQKFLAGLSGRAGALLRSAIAKATLPAFMRPQFVKAEPELKFLEGWQERPLATYAHCLCELR
jgi:protease-4